MVEKKQGFGITYARVLAFTIYWLCGHEQSCCFKVYFSISAGDVINTFFFLELFHGIYEICY